MEQTAPTARRPRNGKPAGAKPISPQPRPRPTYRLYQVIGEGKTASWREIGAAWPNKDGAGFSLLCNALPLHGRLVMRRIPEETKTSEVRQ